MESSPEIVKIAQDLMKIPGFNEAMVSWLWQTCVGMGCVQNGGWTLYVKGIEHMRSRIKKRKGRKDLEEASGGGWHKR